MKVSVIMTGLPTSLTRHKKTASNTSAKHTFSMQRFYPIGHSWKKAKDSINEYSGGTPVSQVMYGNYGAEVRRSPKTGKSLDYIHRTSGQGITAPMEIYYDELAPQNRKKKRKKKWLSMYSRLM